jgi:hypothetical protein
LGVFQKLLASKALDHEAFAILGALMERLPAATFDVHLRTIWQLLFQRWALKAVKGYEGLHKIRRTSVHSMLKAPLKAVEEYEDLRGIRQISVDTILKSTGGNSICFIIFGSCCSRGRQTHTQEIRRISKDMTTTQ